MDLHTPAIELKGIGQKTVKLYEKLGLSEAEDFLYYFPRDYMKYDENEVINYVHKMEQRGEEINRQDLAYSFQDKVTSIMVNNTIRCARDNKINKVVIAGGVGSNEMLREKMDSISKRYNIEVFYPPIKLCTDNAVMIASEAYHAILAGKRPVDIDLDANANLKITD